MSNVKASDTVVIRKLIQSRGPETMNAMLAKLTTTRELFRTVTANEWLPLKAEAEILQSAADVLYPNAPQALRRLAVEVSKINFSGIYKAFLLIATPEFVIKRISKIWRTFFDQGEAKIEIVSPKNVVMVGIYLPELTAVHHEYICGFIAGVLELTSAKMVAIAFDSGNPNAWRWNIKWT